MRIAVDDIEIAYELEGPAGAEVVVFGHSFAADRSLWARQAAALDSYRTLRFDARGHGDSGWSDAPLSFARLADDVAALMDALGIERAHFCGISMSGMIGQHLALRHGHRLRSLALVNTTSRYDAAQRAGWQERLEIVRNEGIAPLHDALMARWFAPATLERRPAEVASVGAHMSSMRPSVFASYLELLREVDTAALLGGIAVPTLVVAGALDPGTPPAMSEVLHAGIAGSELVMIEDAWHISPVDQPERFDAILRDFLGRR